MKRLVSHTLLSHKKNGYAPKLLAEVGAAVLFVLILVTFEAASFQTSFIIGQKSLAAVYSSSLETLTNQDRASEGLTSLKVNPLLEAAAQAKANDMVAKGYFAHYAPDGTSPWYWISKAGYQFSYAGENLAINFSDSGVVNDAWLASPLHRANILNPHYTDIGIATAEGMYQGQETTFVVQMFGTPAEAPSSVAGEAGVGFAPLNWIAGSPRTTLAIVYVILALFICIALLAIIAAGVRRHNIRQIVYAVILLVLMLLLAVALIVMTGSVTIG